MRVDCSKAPEAVLIGQKLALMGVPSSAGARRTGTDGAPAALRKAGILESLRGQRREILDFGDLHKAVFHPDAENPKEQNRNLVRGVIDAVALQTQRASLEGAAPAVIGGDCTITIGVLAGLLSRFKNMGLIYFDGDLDLNTPEVTPSGIFDGMGLAHIVGHGSRALSHAGPRFPLLAEDCIVAVGYNTAAGWIDPYELEAFVASQIVGFPVSYVRTDPVKAAKQALGSLEGKVGKILVHFDVDVIDADEFPSVDVPHAYGLEFDKAIEALQVFVSSPKCCGFVVTEFNADLDEDGSFAKRLVAGLGKAFAAEPRSAAVG